MVAFDGVYSVGADGRPEFHELSPQEDEDVRQVTTLIAGLRAEISARSRKIKEAGDFCVAGTDRGCPSRCCRTQEELLRLGSHRTQRRRDESGHPRT